MCIFSFPPQTRATTWITTYAGKYPKQSVLQVPILLAVYWFVQWCRAARRSFNITVTAQEEHVVRVNIDCTNLGFLPPVASLRVVYQTLWRGAWRDELEVQGYRSWNLCLCILFPWVVLAVFWYQERAIFLPHHASVWQKWSGCRLYLILNVIYAQVMKPIIRHKSAIAKGIILNFC